MGSEEGIKNKFSKKILVFLKNHAKFLYNYLDLGGKMEVETKSKKQELQDEQDILDARIEEDAIDEDSDEENYEYNLTSFGIDFTAKGIVDKLASEEIYIPDFQRDYVWNNTKASQFIESLIMSLPVPGIFLALDEERKYQVVDGLQRIMSLYSFCQGLKEKKPLKLTKVNSSLLGKTYSTLSDRDKRTLDNAIIHSTIIRVNDPEEENYNAIFLIFERLNTGGMLLSAQEIRNSIFHKCNALKLINKLADEDEFKNFLGISPKRKKHQEICLRLFCLAQNWEKYNIKNLKGFLNKCLEHTFLLQINSSKPTDHRIEPNEEKFRRTLEIIIEQYETSVKPYKRISLPLLDAVFVTLYNNLEAIEKAGTEKVADEIKRVLGGKEIQEFLGQDSTHRPENLRGRIRLVHDAVVKKLSS